MQYRDSNNHKGIDIASHQRGLDFALVKEAGTEIVYIKATEGLNYTNPYLKQHYQEAKDQGLYIGFYHYFIPSVDATQQAIYFYNAIKDMPYDVRPMLDVEVDGGFGKRVLTTLVHECLNEIKYLTKHTPVIYTYTYFAKDHLVSEGISGYPPWMADYNDSGRPGSNPIWDSWIGYQYSSKGDIGGIRVDLDEFTNEIFIGGGIVENWKINLVTDAVKDGLLTETHDPEQMVPIWLLLAVIYNAKAKGVI